MRRRFSAVLPSAILFFNVFSLVRMLRIKMIKVATFSFVICGSLLVLETRADFVLSQSMRLFTFLPSTNQNAQNVKKHKQNERILLAVLYGFREREYFIF